MRPNTLLALSGIAFVVLVVLAVVGIGGSTPGTNASGARLASFYSGDAVRQELGTFLLAAAAPFILLFGFGLTTALQPRDMNGVSAWGSVLRAGAILVAIGVLVASFVHFALANGADETISPSALQALNVLDGNTWMVFNPAFGVLMLGAAGVVLTQERLRWLGWIALALGIAAFVPFMDFFALLGTLLWIAVTSVVLALVSSKPERTYAAAHRTV